MPINILCYHVIPKLYKIPSQITLTMLVNAKKNAGGYKITDKSHAGCKPGMTKVVFVA